MNPASAIQLLTLDVDGILTDGKITYASNGEELKSFNIRDGLGIKWLQESGIQVAIITGRLSPMVARRASELSIHHVIQGREDKLIALQELADKLHMPFANIAYAGDDYQDLAAIQAAGLGLTVADAHEDVQQAADWVSGKPGGQGAVRDFCEYILDAQGALDSIKSGYRICE